MAAATTGRPRAGSLRRAAQIARIAAAEWRPARRGQPAADRIHRALIRLGPTFIKLGQVASTRPDLVPPDISERLRDLQEQVPPFDFATARATVETELGRPLEEAFATFPVEPVASASLSQVYLAELPDGTPIAVKVQRPNLRPIIERDLAILRGLARTASLVRPSLRALRPSVAIGEFGRWTLQELDFEVEGHNLDEFRANFADWDDVVFPAVYWSHTTPRVLTMQRVDGMRLWDVTDRHGPAFARRVASRLAELQMKMFVTDQFFHADLHPGNIFFQPDGRMAILDVGMVGRMTVAQRDRFLVYWIAITRRQPDRAFEHLLAMAASTAGADLAGFRAVYDRLLDRFYDAQLAEHSLAQTYLEILIAGARHGVSFPPELVLQAKAVVTAEALDLVLAPDFRFADEVRPIVARELARRATPQALLDRVWSGLVEWTLLGEWSATADPPTTATPDEDRFRRAAIEAIAGEWADAADGRLQRLQGDLPRYLSADHWQQHPELHALLETVAGLSWQLAAGLARSEQRHDTATGGNGHHPAAAPDTDVSPDGHPVGTRLRDATATLQHDLRDLTRQRPWLERWQARTTATALTTLLRTLIGRTERAITEATKTPATKRGGRRTGDRP